MTSLWPYQARAIEMLDNVIASGSRAPLLVAPTGSGKTVIAAALMRRAAERGQRVLFLAPRRELVVQTSRKLTEVPHGILLAGHAGQDLYAPVQVASIDTLLSRLVRRKGLTLPPFELVLIDEAHLSITETRHRLLNFWSDALRIGLTATPTRKDGKALGLMYDRLVEPVTTADLTPQYLVPARYFSISEPDLQRVRITAGDYNGKDLDAVMRAPDLVADVTATWLERASGRRTVVFASSIAHSVALCEEFLRSGVSAEHVDAGTPQAERDAIFERFRSGATQVLTNCYLASYGFDLPELSAVVLARPTKSLMLYLQMLGRGLRIAEGKADCLVLDHSGCVHRHGFAADRREWTLSGKFALVPSPTAPRDRSEAKALTCPECQCVFSGGRTCPECGYYFAPKGRELRTLEGRLVEIGQHLKPDQQDRAAFYAELRGYGAEKGWKPGAAAHRYRERYGDFPPWGWNGMPLALPSKATRDWLLSRVIARKNSRRPAKAAQLPF